MQDTRQSTARANGSVGRNAVLPEVVKQVAEQDKSICAILDFGAGPARRHVRDLNAHFGHSVEVVGYDLGDAPELLHEEWDLVFASNVLNVQESTVQLYKTLYDLWDAQGPGRLLVNYPKGPRKLDMSKQEMRLALECFGWQVREIPSRGNSTVWELIKQ